jgi:hypothetical protein
MFLAGIVPKYETELICDFAETYHILDWRTLPLNTAAALSVGLRENSRVKMKIAGVEAGQDTLLLAAIVDRLSLLWWAKTKDAESGRNKPKSIFEQLTRRPEDEPEKKVTAFRSGEEIRAAWAKATGQIKEVE